MRIGRFGGKISRGVPALSPPAPPGRWFVPRERLGRPLRRRTKGSALISPRLPICPTCWRALACGQIGRVPLQERRHSTLLLSGSEPTRPAPLSFPAIFPRAVPACLVHAGAVSVARGCVLSRADPRRRPSVRHSEAAICQLTPSRRGNQNQPPQSVPPQVGSRRGGEPAVGKVLSPLRTLSLFLFLLCNPSCGNSPPQPIDHHPFLSAALPPPSKCSAAPLVAFRN